MTCWIHNWEILHKEEPVLGHWFVDRKCNRCGKQEIKSHSPFFGSVDDSIRLGTAIGIYKAIGGGKFQRMFDDMLDEELKKRGLTRKDIGMRRKDTHAE